MINKISTYEGSINAKILEQWDKAQDCLLANRELCDTNIYTLIHNSKDVRDEEYCFLYRIYYNETLENERTN